MGQIKTPSNTLQARYPAFADFAGFFCVVLYSLRLDSIMSGVSGIRLQARIRRIFSSQNYGSQLCGGTTIAP
jgi:hypothetical protein